jgi:hypothetical protein
MHLNKMILRLQLFENVRDLVKEYADNDSSCIKTAVLAEALTQKGYKVRMKYAVGGGEGSNCLHNLRHTFLSVSGEVLIDFYNFVGIYEKLGSYFFCADGSNTNMIVDPGFAEQFQIAKSSDRYAMLLACLPTVLVIPEERIVPLVSLTYIM